MEMMEYPFDGAAILQKKRVLRKTLLAQENLVDKKIAVVCGSTVGDIQPVLELFLLSRGIRPQFFVGGYGLFYEDVVFNSGPLRDFAPDLLYVHTSSRNIRAWPHPADTPEAARQKLEGELARYEEVWRAAQKLGCLVVQNNFEAPLWRNFGHMDAWDARGRVQFTRRLNESMADFARKNQWFFVHDLDYLASCIGLDNFCDNAAWHAYKYACAPQHIPHLCSSLANLVAGLFGRVKKGVVLDLDNTLWGGVVGETGPQGIEIGSESPTGEAYAEFQQYLAMLAARGVFLGVASKNELDAAEAGLAREENPLKRGDIVAFRAGWWPKSQSMAEIATQLNIGTDSLVFMDDNPAERAEVQNVYPEVSAPPVAQPEHSIALLDRAGYFEAVSLSQDDVARVGMMRQNAARQQQQQSFADYDDFLRSLQMTAEIAPFAPDTYERTTQLINKTNQFNMTTRRYTLAEVSAAAEDSRHITLAGKLRDKFGDNGLTSALIAKARDGGFEIELWVMSCRVFKRQLEYAMFDALVRLAKAKGAAWLYGRWSETPKNLLVRQFYDTIGFELVEDTGGERLYRYRIPNKYEAKNTAIKAGKHFG